MTNAILFDYDGTLADAREAFAQCYRVAAQKLALTEPSSDDVAPFIGTPVPVAFQTLFPQADPALAIAFASEFQRSADDLMVPMTRMYDGVSDAVRKLHDAGYKLGIVSQKLHRRLESMLERDGLSDCFGVVIGGDDMPAFKPDPRGLLIGIQRMDSTPDETLFVGDTPIDGETARNADVRFIAVTTGVYTGEQLSAYEPVAILNSVADLPAYLGIETQTT